MAAVSLTALLPRVPMDSNPGETMTYRPQGPFRTGRHESSESTLEDPCRCPRCRYRIVQETECVTGLDG